MRYKSLTAFIIAALAGCAILWQLVIAGRHDALFVDFRAFYCAGWTLAHHANPYTIEPIFSCERSAQPFGLYSVAVPIIAPFPGYALAAWTLLSWLPYPVAAAFWLGFLIAAYAFGSILLARVCVIPVAGAIAVTALAFAVAVIPHGQLTPILLCALCGAALAVRDKRIAGATAWLAVLALAPNLALPVFAALFVFRREMRWPVVGLSIALLAVHVAVMGPQLAVAYFTRILPAHDASEIGFINQFSLTWMLAAAGVPSRIALAFGNAAYGVLCLAGIWFSGNLARRFRDPAFLLVIPAAFAVTGGSYVHYSQVLVALPAAMLLFSSSKEMRSFSAAATLLLAIPWLSMVSQPAILPAAVTAVAAISLITLGLNAVVTLRAAFGAAAFSASILVAAALVGPQMGTPQSPIALDAGLADASRATQIAKTGTSSGFIWWLAKLPTWIGLLLVASQVTLEVSRARRDQAEAVDVDALLTTTE